ncbi:hypothetical protein [Rhodanobacter ginsengiterrae]|uniref:hypothetical protein n=1 Tax=Rhodanobacter ginsengiterrae TaxID=2008451 RepID=UPI003CEBB113
MGIVWLIAAMAVVMLGLPAFPLLLARLGGGSDALESSFAQQQVPCASGPIPASALLVLHRTPGMTMYSNQGDLMNVDASWLCRAPDGSYLLALGAGTTHAERDGMAAVESAAPGNPLELATHE